MAQEEIEITIGPDGQVTFRTIGFKGPRCLTEAEALARIVGQEQSRQLTSEFYESEQRVDGRVDVRQHR